MQKLTNCINIDLITSLNFYKKCWDGSCVGNAFECPSPIICPYNFHYKCPNGTCVSYRNQCTEKNCPDYMPILCMDGTCGRAYHECPSFNICPLEYPFYCLPLKLCVKDEVSCKFQFELPTKCPKFLPFQCFDGSCKEKLTDCPTKVFCSLDKPFFCESDGQCKISKYYCQVLEFINKSICGNNSKPCLDGSCSNSTLCGTHKTCTIEFPIKCPDGSCVQSPVDCSISTCELPNHFICHSLGKCLHLANRSLCPSTVRCPLNTPIKCPDDNCVSSLENCSKNITKIKILKNERCPNDKNLFICPNGLCVSSKINCPLDLHSKMSECLMKNLDIPFPCWDGSCVSDGELCKPGKIKNNSMRAVYKEEISSVTNSS